MIAATTNQMQAALSATILALPADAEAEFAALDQTATRITITRDEVLFFEGDPARYGYKLVSGALRNCRLLADGRRHIADFIMPGTLIGFDADDVHRFTAEAMTEAVLLRYPRAAIDRLIEQRSRVARTLLRRLSNELSAAQQQLLLLGRKTATERLASFLLGMSERSGTPDRVQLPMTRLDIADYLGLTIETVSRGFSQFKSQNLIQLTGNNVVLLRDRDALEEIAEAA